MRALQGRQLGRHSLDLRAKEQVEHQGFNHIIAVMAQRNFCGPDFRRLTINNSPPQTRT